jgi:peptide/nickel transport system permease protein
MGLHKPVHEQYVDFLQGLLVGDLGMSLTYQNPVLVDIVHFLPATLELITVAMFFTVTFGVSLGVIAALNKDGVIDNVTRVVSFFSVSVPGFFIGILFQLIFAYWFGLFPITGRISSTYGDVVTRQTGFLLVDTLLQWNIAAHIDTWLHLLLPAMSLSLVGMGQVMRITRSSMIDILNKDFVQAERGYGLPSWLINFKYALKNAFIAPLTILGLLYASLLGNAFLIELVFSWPGLATYGVNAVFKNDVNAIVGVTMTVGLAFVSVNFVIDLLLSAVDPRIRIERAGS